MSDIYSQAGRRSGGETHPKVRFDQPGAFFEGTVVLPRLHTFAGDSEPTLIVDVRDDLGNTLSIIAGPMSLHNALVELAAQPNERIRVQRGADTPLPNGNRAHNYTADRVGGAPAPQQYQQQAPAGPQPQYQQPAPPQQPYQQPAPVAPPQPQYAPPPAPQQPAPVAPPQPQYQQPAPDQYPQQAPPPQQPPAAPLV